MTPKMRRFNVLLARLALVLSLWLVFSFQGISLADLGLQPLRAQTGLLDHTKESATGAITNDPPVLKQNAIDDPCLPSLYKDWAEFSLDSEDYRRSNRITGARIRVDLEKCRMTLDAILTDGTTRAVIDQNVAVGDPKTPTPVGALVMNHVYCYPDVLFFGEKSGPVHGLYNGFFAPLLKCDENGNCSRFNELGLHGFQAGNNPNQAPINPATFGAISAGCVRVSDPCALKMELIRLVGVGPLRKNDRGSYHWLRKPVQVVIRGVETQEQDREEVTLVSIIQDSISSLGSDFSNMLRWLTQE